MDPPSKVESGLPDGRLDSWKEIAAYLGRNERTVRRWEEREGLPVHRLAHEKRGSVYAYKRELDDWWELRRTKVEVEEELGADPVPAVSDSRFISFRSLAWMLAGALFATAIFGGLSWRSRRQDSLKNVQFSRVTDLVGTEEAPALSPDGKTLAFVRVGGGRRHIWVRLLSGGMPLRITQDDADHEGPRWSPDSSSLIYYSPSPTPGEEGAIWEIPALGGSPRRIAAALGGGDISHDGKNIALFRSANKGTEIAIAARNGATILRVATVPLEDFPQYPRWSPDDRWIAYQSDSGASFNERICAVPVDGGQPREFARSEEVRGLSWLDNASVVYGSSLGSTILYPPIFNLRVLGLRDGSDHQLTFGDVSYIEPDVQPSGSLVASRVTLHSDVWSFPLDGSPEENVRNAARVTRQTGQIQTPSVSPDGKEIVYLSDSGGHGNLWIARTDGTGPRQLTFEKDPTTAVGVPVWSPAGNEIVFILTRQGQTAQWLINSDGTGLRQVIPSGIWAYWSADGRWLYYVVSREGTLCIERVPVTGGAPERVRADNAVAPAVGDGVFYYATLLKRPGGWSEFEFRQTTPKDGKDEVLAHILAGRVPDERLNFHMILSPDRKWLVTPLVDGAATNLWLLPARGGEMQRVTDFGERATLIVRRVSWSPDSRHVFAAVADMETDIVMLKGLLP